MKIVTKSTFPKNCTNTPGISVGHAGRTKLEENTSPGILEVEEKKSDSQC